MHHAAFAALLLLAISPAQSRLCLAMNDRNQNVVGTLTPPTTSEPNVFAFRVTLPPNASGYHHLEIFTGNTTFAPGFMTLELWHHDPSTNLPWARHAGGTWQISPALGNAWQGTNLDLHIAPPFATTYWLVWTEPGSSTEPYEPGGVTVPAARRTGTTWTPLPPVAPKWRLYCAGFRDGPGARVFGNACPTFRGYWGTLFTNQPPAVGNTAFLLEGTGFDPALGVLLLLGADPNFASLPVPGLGPMCRLHTDIVATLSGRTGTGNVRAGTTIGAAGHVSFALPVPGDPVLRGALVGSQLAVHDPRLGVPLPFTMSNGLRLTLL